LLEETATSPKHAPIDQQARDGQAYGQRLHRIDHTVRRAGLSTVAGAVGNFRDNPGLTTFQFWIAISTSLKPILPAKPLVPFGKWLLN
jgi:hypothetical protein